MKKTLIIVAAALCLVACRQAVECSVPAFVEDGAIVLKAPDRAPGQISALKLACEPIDTVRVGFVGVGSRGRGALHRYAALEGARIAAICDLYQPQLDKAAELLDSKGVSGVKQYVGADGYKLLCEDPDIDLVYICTDWKMHTPVAVYAMEHGKHAAIEVPAAMSIAECWLLVDTCEKTRRHCMMLENCCYDFFELLALNMKQHGLFGEVYYGEGAYIHNLDDFWDRYQDNWRLEYDWKYRGDNYPTHGIGPLCQVFDIHRGDRMDYVVSQDTESYRGLAAAKERMGVDEFADGDHTVSLIRTVNGHLIQIQHNVYGMRPYNRKFELSGTLGYAVKYPSQNFAFGHRGFVSPEEFAALSEQYKFDFVREIEEQARKVGGHGGMDYIMDYRLIRALRLGLPLDEDVYDAAEMSCLVELSRISLEHGSMPVKVPDFTRGDWNVIDGFRYE